MGKPQPTETDRYTSEIIANALVAAGDEMFGALRRSSMSPIIYEALDYSVGITDANGELISQGVGTTVFLGMIDSLVKDIIAKFGDGCIRPGDVFISNDTYAGGSTHLSDIAIVSPVFYEGILIAFTVNKAHWTDVGGMAPGSFTTNSTEIFQEGLQLPFVKIIAQGEKMDGIFDILQANIRFPEASLGDFWAGVAANRVGETRILSLVKKYGPEVVVAAMQALLEYGERMTRAELAKLPKGEFHAEDFIDDDGIGGDPIPVSVKLTITDDKFIADFSGAPPQVLAPINCARHGLVSAARIIFKAVTNPQIPANSGCFRPLEVICPERTIFTVERPGPCSTYWETMLYVKDLIWKAMAELVPDRLSAGHLLSVCANTMELKHPKTGARTLFVQPLVGGWGAANFRDGDRGQFCIADGETYNIPVEIQELKHGVHIRQYALHNEDGGEGEFRGGNGCYLDYEITGEEAYFTGSFIRKKFLPWPCAGGRQGSANYIHILRADGTEEKYGKVTRVRLQKGDVVRCVTATGAGWGDPGRRSAAMIKEDLRNGYITAAQADRFYRGAGSAGRYAG
ncbi:MAG: hydantoinase B/oxoprolinase family protein [Gammaproteobacteria bacterium]|nr:hydantoinase B/oxoprolinase family protein [Gammaproteobacteria bacterium]MCY4211927.1 hydantoinase B/oxoprolinase family protein [Gammaproteobacteria bacterium]MCY4283554.1 hydantoinase B/oxoprolinase family protein [Gammaproteobacteria bacterium]MCY4337841.1 hydantoinase B/oxoprolinase family protein [Gammaproteobacteria bacterium]